MPKARHLWDRVTDAHLILAFAVLVAIAGICVFLFLMPSAQDSQEQRHATLVAGAVLLIGAAGLFTWGGLSLAAERRRRARLAGTVDSEMSKKWKPGFAHLVGAYEKPWYLLCGETSVGKTAALKAAQLPMAYGPDGQHITDATQGTGGTYLFDWWFYENAVVLDSAGDLIQNPDSRWRSFLQRVREARPIQPINGVILAVSAGDLLAGGDVLAGKAALLGSQVAVAREELKVRFPLYLLITKCDLIPGFADYFPPTGDLKSSFQILGWSNPQDPRVDDRPTSAADVSAGLRKLLDDLRVRRSAVLARTISARPDARSRLDHLDEMFCFTDVVQGFLGNLEQFVSQLLSGSITRDAFTNQPEPPPFMRGIYFTSALRTGEAPDLELQKAFRLTRPPQMRRTASDRAFFLRDLMLEKVIPEGGMVAPLENVVTGARRRGRALAAGAFLGAALIVGGTLVGYAQTAGKIRPHRDLWTRLADLSDHGQLSELDLVDQDGKFRGDQQVNGMGMTVLEVHEQIVKYARLPASSPLLPITGKLDHERSAGARAIFIDHAVVPLLRPAASDHPGNLPHGEELSMQLQLVSEGLGRMAKPAATDPVLLAQNTLRLRPDSSRERLRQLLEDGGKSFQSEIALNPAQCALVKDSSVKWISRYLDAVTDRNLHYRDAVKQAIEAIAGLSSSELLELEWLSEKPGQESSKPPGQSINRITAPDVKKLVDNLTNAACTEPADRSKALDDAISSHLAVPNEIQKLSEYGEVAERITNYKNQMNEALALLGDATGLKGRMHAFQQLEIGTDPSKPLIVSRFEVYDLLRRTAGDWIKNDAQTNADFNPLPDRPFYIVTKVIRTRQQAVTALRAKCQELIATIGDSPTADADSNPNSTLRSAVAHFASNWESYRSQTAWRYALKSPDTIWQLAPGTKLNFQINLTRSNGYISLPNPDSDLVKLTSQLDQWIEALKAAEGETSAASVSTELQAVHKTLEKTISDYVEGWGMYLDQLQSAPSTLGWSAVSGKALNLQAIEEDLNRSCALARKGLQIAAQFQLKANDQLKRIPEPAAGGGVRDAVRTILMGWKDKSATDARHDALTAGQLKQFANAAAHVEDVQNLYWQSLLDQSVNALVTAARPDVTGELNAISTIANQFPFVQQGKVSWDPHKNADVLKQLTDDFASLVPDGNIPRTGRPKRILELSTATQPALISEKWQEFILKERVIISFLGENNRSFSVAVTGGNKDVGKQQGSWEAVNVYTTKAGKAFRRTIPPHEFSFRGIDDLYAPMHIDLLVAVQADGSQRPADELIDDKFVDVKWPLLRCLSANSSDAILRVRESEGAKEERTINIHVQGLTGLDIPGALPPISD